MQSDNLVIFSENGGLLNSTLITQDDGTSYRNFRVNHPPISTGTTSSLNLQVAEFYKKFLLEKDAFLRKLQIFNEKGFSFYGISTINDWITVKNLSIIKTISGLPELLELTLPKPILYQKGQLFRTRLVTKNGSTQDIRYVTLTGESNNLNLYPILEINRNKLRFLNPLNGIVDISTDWNITFDLQVQFVGGIELHDYDNFSNWNQKDFLLQFDTSPDEFIDRPFTVIGIDGVPNNTKFYSIGEKIVKTSNSLVLNIIQIMDRIYGDLPDYTFSNSILRLSLHNTSIPKGIGQSRTGLYYQDPGDFSSYSGIICETPPLELTFGDWCFISVVDILIKNKKYPVTSASLNQKIRIISKNSNIFYFDRILDNDFICHPDKNGNLPDPADFQAAIKKGKLLFTFNRFDTVSFQMPAQIKSDFLNNSLQFFENLKNIQLIPYDTYLGLDWPYITIDPRGSFSGYTVSVDIDGEFIFGYSPTELGPEIYTFEDFYPSEINPYTDCKINVINNLFIEAYSEYTQIKNVLPINITKKTNRLIIGNASNDGTFEITLNGLLYSYTSIQNNTRNVISDWIEANKFYIETQQSILVSIEDDVDPNPVILNIISKYPSVDYTLEIDESYNRFTNTYNIISITQNNFPSTFGIILGQYNRSVNTYDLSIDTILTTVSKSEIAYNRWLSEHQTELESYGFSFRVVYVGSDISLQIYDANISEPEKITLNTFTKGWFKEVNILNTVTPYQAIQSSKLYRISDGFSFVDMQIRPDDRILIEGSIFRINNREYIVQGVFNQYLIVAVLDGSFIEGVTTYYDYYVEPDYFIDGLIIKYEYEDIIPINPIEDAVQAYVLDKLFYPRGNDPHVAEKLVFEWVIPEDEKKFFFIDLSGESLSGSELDRIPYIGRKPLYLPNIKRKIYLIDSYNKNKNRNKNPYFQQTEFQKLYRDLPKSDNISLNWRNYPMSLILGYRSFDEVAHHNICNITTQKNICMHIIPEYRRNIGYIRDWSLISNVLECQDANFVDCGFFTSDPIEIIVELESILSKTSIVAKNIYWTGVVSNVDVHRLTLKGITTLYDEIGIEDGTIKKISIKILPVLIGKIEIWGETEEEDNRLEIGLRNYGIPFRQSDAYIFRQYTEWEWGNDWRVINRRRKDMLMNKREIWDYVGSYRAIINSIKLFGHPDILVWNWALNLDTESNYYGNWQRIQLVKVGDAVDTGWDGVDKDQDPPRATPRWQRNNWIHLVWPRTDENGKFTKLYTERDEILQLGLLKRWEIENVVPMYNKLLDISSWSQNPWVYWEHGELTKVYYKSFKASAEAIGFKTESYLNPISENYSSWICSIRFENQNLPPQGFWIIIKTFVQENGWKGKRVVQVYQEFRRTLEAYNFILDLNHDPYATIETIVEDPDTGLKAYTRHSVDITSRTIN